MLIIGKIDIFPFKIFLIRCEFECSSSLCFAFFLLQACEECELAEATLQCKECEENFCDICFERIHRKGSRKDHMGVIIQKKVNFDNFLP